MEREARFARKMPPKGETRPGNSGVPGVGDGVVGRALTVLCTPPLCVFCTCANITYSDNYTQKAFSKSTFLNQRPEGAGPGCQIGHFCHF